LIRRFCQTIDLDAAVAERFTVCKRVEGLLKHLATGLNETAAATIVSSISFD
jgi:hypothetical protein